MGETYDGDGEMKVPSGAVRMRQPVFEIVAIGNELLIGRTLDTNSHWLAIQIAKLGGELRQKTTVRDKQNEIARAVRDSLMRRPDFLITLGGLGPTHDDITLSSISRVLERRLVLNLQALHLLRERYLERFGPSVKLTRPRIKMARFPEGAEPLPNPVGTAPAPYLRIRGTRLIALPGVPKEMRAIFRKSVVKMVEDFGCTRRYYDESMLLLGIPESTLAPIIDEVMRKHRDIYIKSHPRGIEKDGRARIELHFRTCGVSQQAPKARLDRALATMKRKLRGKATVRNAG